MLMPNERDRYWCNLGCGFVDKDHRCEQWCTAIWLPADALDAYREELIAPLLARIAELEGGKQETLSDQKRKTLFCGDGIAYIRHRALKHEKQYGDMAQAMHLRTLATQLETKIAELEAEKKTVPMAMLYEIGQDYNAYAYGLENHFRETISRYGYCIIEEE